MPADNALATTLSSDDAQWALAEILLGCYDRSSLVDILFDRGLEFTNSVFAYLKEQGVHIPEHARAIGVFNLSKVRALVTNDNPRFEEICKRGEFYDPRGLVTCLKANQTILKEVLQRGEIGLKFPPNEFATLAVEKADRETDAPHWLAHFLFEPTAVGSNPIVDENGSIDAKRLIVELTSHGILFDEIPSPTPLASGKNSETSIISIPASAESNPPATSTNSAKSVVHESAENTQVKPPASAVFETARLSGPEPFDSATATTKPDELELMPVNTPATSNPNVAEAPTEPQPAVKPVTETVTLQATTAVSTVPQNENLSGDRELDAMSLPTPTGVTTHISVTPSAAYALLQIHAGKTVPGGIQNLVGTGIMKTLKELGVIVVEGRRVRIDPNYAETVRFYPQAENTLWRSRKDSAPPKKAPPETWLETWQDDLATISCYRVIPPTNDRPFQGALYALTTEEARALYATVRAPSLRCQLRTMLGGNTFDYFASRHIITNVRTAEGTLVKLNAIELPDLRFVPADTPGHELFPNISVADLAQHKSPALVDLSRISGIVLEMTEPLPVQTSVTAPTSRSNPPAPKSPAVPKDVERNAAIGRAAPIAPEGEFPHLVRAVLSQVAGATPLDISEILSKIPDQKRVAEIDASLAPSLGVALLEKQIAELQRQLESLRAKKEASDQTSVAKIVGFVGELVAIKKRLKDI